MPYRDEVVAARARARRLESQIARRGASLARRKAELSRLRQRILELEQGNPRAVARRRLGIIGGAIAAVLAFLITSWVLGVGSHENPRGGHSVSVNRG